MLSVRPFLTIDAAKTVVNSLLSSRLDYCNSLLYGVSDYFIVKLQRMQNWAARVVLNLRKTDSATKALYTLHWLPVSQRIKYKIILMVYKCLKGLAPEYLSSLLHYQEPARVLRSSQKLFMLKVNRYKLETMGKRAFSCAGPCLWNRLPDNIRNVELTTNEFKKRLKTFLFQEHFGSE